MLYDQGFDLEHETDRLSFAPTNACFSVVDCEYFPIELIRLFEISIFANGLQRQTEHNLLTINT